MTNEEKEEVRKQALFLTNTAYLLADKTRLKRKFPENNKQRESDV